MQFQFFGLSHLVALGTVLVACLACPLLRPVLGASARRAVRLGLAALMFASEIGYLLWPVHAGNWTAREHLPLHLCAAMTFIGVAMLLTANRGLYAIVYFLGIGGATQAMVTPNLGEYGYPHALFFALFVTHGTVVVAGVYMTVVEGFRPSWRSLWRVFVGMLAYTAVIGLVNFLLGSNYLFIAHKPETPSLIDLLGPWPWYILPLTGVGLITMVLLYSPFAIRDAWAARRARGSALPLPAGAPPP